MPLAILEGMVMAIMGVTTVTSPGNPLFDIPVVNAARHMTAITAGLSSMMRMVQAKLRPAQAQNLAAIMQMACDYSL